MPYRLELDNGKFIDATYDSKAKAIADSALYRTIHGCDVHVIDTTTKQCITPNCKRREA